MNDVLAIIPARGGSKGLPGKNILGLKGIPLIAHTILAAKSSKVISRVVVSTEDSHIANIGKSFGAEVPCLRPKELAEDSSNVIEAIFHMLNYLKTKENYNPKYIVLLQGTSPLRNSNHIDEAIEKMINGNFNGIISVCECEVNPYWTNIFKGDQLEYFIKEGKNISRRQDLPKIYRYNGAIFAATEEFFLKEKSFEGKGVTGYVMDRESSVDIDTEFDFNLVKMIMENEEI